jgi:hypothetical protein
MSGALIHQIVMLALPLIFAIVFHEVAHGWAARALGDPTAHEAKRLSLNPLRHVDPIGTVVLPGCWRWRICRCSVGPSRCRSMAGGCAIRASA